MMRGANEYRLSDPYPKTDNSLIDVSLLGAFGTTVRGADNENHASRTACPVRPRTCCKCQAPGP
eukprot:3089239-Pyramimonas_sp.AAC.1